MASVASQLIEEVNGHEQSDSLENVRGICADGSYFPNNFRTNIFSCTSERLCRREIERVPYGISDLSLISIIKGLYIFCPYLYPYTKYTF